VNRSGELHTGFEICLLGGDRRCAEMSTEQFAVYSSSHSLLASDQRFRVRPQYQRRLASRYSTLPRHEDHEDSGISNDVIL
jgi:hypothetical protein